ncbi:MAG: methyltransferase domain-containing protein [Anaerolineales bacterium]|jgi:ubiquinone/menaquinone biosynthesis C-methylase UbiE
MLRELLKTILAIPLLLIALHTIIRIVRRFHKFPMPQFMANLIDNPLRRRIQPPHETPIRHGVQPGMTVLEIGPGNGTYTIATARRVGNSGKIITVDIEPRMIQRVTQRADAEGITNIEARLADVYELPFEDETFDLVYMIAVINEIPNPESALNEFQRVLKSNGKLVFSELFLDPDYQLAGTLIRRVNSAGFQLIEKIGNVFYYTLIFGKKPYKDT